jgi:hypothetical protein
MKSSTSFTDESSDHDRLYPPNTNIRIEENCAFNRIVKTGGCCWLCGYLDDPRIIQKHHIAGKRNSDITIPVCPTCHAILSLEQYSWPKNWTLANNSPTTRVALIARSVLEMNILSARAIQSILKEKSKEPGKAEGDHGRC